MKNCQNCRNGRTRERFWNIDPPPNTVEPNEYLPDGYMWCQSRYYVRDDRVRKDVEAAAQKAMVKPTFVCEYYDREDAYKFFPSIYN